MKEKDVLPLLHKNVKHSRVNRHQELVVVYEEMFTSACPMSGLVRIKWDTSVNTHDALHVKYLSGLTGLSIWSPADDPLLRGCVQKL